MTAESLLEKLQHYETALLEIADKIARQTALEEFQRSFPYASEAHQSGRAHAYKKIARIVDDVLKRYANDPSAVASSPSSQSVH